MTTLSNFEEVYCVGLPRAKIKATLGIFTSGSPEGIGVSLKEMPPREVRRHLVDVHSKECFEFFNFSLIWEHGYVLPSFRAQAIAWAKKVDLGVLEIEHSDGSVETRYVKDFSILPSHYFSNIDKKSEVEEVFNSYSGSEIAKLENSIQEMESEYKTEFLNQKFEVFAFNPVFSKELDNIQGIREFINISNTLKKMQEEKYIYAISKLQLEFSDLVFKRKEEEIAEIVLYLKIMKFSGFIWYYIEKYFSEKVKRFGLSSEEIEQAIQE
ncbi:MAG: hypothetical protein ACTSV7_13705, partial [Candidatus Baldrarchaeia archaeon]